MTAAELVDKETERGNGRPDRHVYSLTERGQEKLREWLRAPVEPRMVVRNELLLKVFFGAQISSAAIREHVEGLLREAEVERTKYVTIATDLKKNSANDPSLAYWLMTLNMRRHDASAKIAWCRETLAELKELERGGRDDA